VTGVHDTRPVIGVHLPDVAHCRGHAPLGADPVTVANSTCGQCDGTHDHVWAACTTVGHLRSHTREPVRCVVCGGRKCTTPACTSRLGHADMHVLARGAVREIPRLPED
jgi:hypothetical protein